MCSKSSSKTSMASTSTTCTYSSKMEWSYSQVSIESQSNQSSWTVHPMGPLSLLLDVQMLTIRMVSLWLIQNNAWLITTRSTLSRNIKWPSNSIKSLSREKKRSWGFSTIMLLKLSRFLKVEVLVRVLNFPYTISVITSSNIGPISMHKF